LHHRCGAAAIETVGVGRVSGRRASPRSSTVVPRNGWRAFDRDGGYVLLKRGNRGTAISGATQPRYQAQKRPARFPARAQFRSFNFPNKLICITRSSFRKMVGEAAGAAPSRACRDTAHLPRFTGGCVRRRVCYPDPKNKGRVAAGGESIMSWWPGWNSIEGAAKWGDIFFWAGF